MKRKIQIFIIGMSLALLFGTLSSFQNQVMDEDEQINQLIEEAIAEKVNDYKQKKLKGCQESILKKASMQVDSTLRARALQPKIDTVSQMAKPVKPIKPSIRLPKDSFVDLVPILSTETETTIDTVE